MFVSYSGHACWPSTPPDHSSSLLSASTGGTSLQPQQMRSHHTLLENRIRSLPLQAIHPNSNTDRTTIRFEFCHYILPSVLFFWTLQSRGGGQAAERAEGPAALSSQAQAENFPETHTPAAHQHAMLRKKAAQQQTRLLTRMKLPQPFWKFPQDIQARPADLTATRPASPPCRDPHSPLSPPRLLHRKAGQKL